MASTYSSNLKIELMGTGENAGTWGNITNTNLGTALEQSVVGLGNPDFTSDANLTITLTDSNAAQAARALVLNVTSAFGSLTVTRELVVPTIQKQYIVQNNTTGGQSITVKTSGGTGITVPNGRKAHLYVDGTNVVQMFDFVDINGGAIDGTTVGAAAASTGAFTTLTSSSTTALNGTTIPASVTLVSTTATQTLTNKTISADDNTLSGIAASSFVLSNGSGNIDGSAAQKAIPSGAVVGTTDTQTLTNKTISADDNTLSGIAASSFVLSNASGNVDGSAAQKVIPAGTVVGTSDTQTLTNKSISGSTNTITNVSLTTGVTGTLPVGNGGTGATTLTANNVILGNGTSAPLFVAPGTTGNVLTSNGTTWASTTPSGGSTLTISNKTGAYTVVAGDAGTVIDCTSGTFTVSLTAAATLGSGFNVTIWNTSATATDVITIDPAGAETIDGRTTLVLRRGEGMQIVCDGTNWQTGDKKVMRGYAENYASGVARGSVSGSGSIALGPGTASGDFSFAVGLNANASGARSIALANANSGLTTASGSNSTAIGANSNGSGSQAGTGAGAMALGGSYASGADSFAAAIANNTSSYGATGGNSIAMGSLAKSTADGLALGGLALSTNSNIAISSAALRGLGATASSNGGCIAIGGNVTASAFSSVAIGQDAVSSDSGKFVFSPVRLAVNGDAQTGTKVVSASTTNATPKALSMGDFGATYQVILPNNSAYAFSGTIVARQQAADGTASAAWKVEGLIRREANAASTTLVASTVTDISNVPVWVIALTADTTNGGLAVTATGAAATDIRWVATIQTSEVTYA